jgi:hypothetical protein
MLAQQSVFGEELDMGIPRLTKEARSGAPGIRFRHKAKSRAAGKSARATLYSRSGRGSAGLKTFSAEYGAALRGAEGDGGLFSASRAGGLSLDLGVAVGLSGSGGRAEDRDPLGLAGFAALGLVLELFIVKEQLFPGSENEITSTVDTFQHLVLKFH